MTRWLVRAAIALVAMAGFLYVFSVRFEDGRLIVERRHEAEQAEIKRRVDDLGRRAQELKDRMADDSVQRDPAAPVPPAAATRQAAEPEPEPASEPEPIPAEDREALETILEENP